MSSKKWPLSGEPMQRCELLFRNYNEWMQVKDLCSAWIGFNTKFSISVTLNNHEYLLELFKMTRNILLMIASKYWQLKMRDLNTILQRQDWLSTWLAWDAVSDRGKGEVGMKQASSSVFFLFLNSCEAWRAKSAENMSREAKGVNLRYLILNTK